MSGGWFFVVASEAIAVGDFQIALPGVGSYVARAIQAQDLVAVGWSIIAMTIAILLCDQLLFRPLVAWADKFRFEQSAAQVVPRSWVLDVLRASRALRPLSRVLGTAVQRATRLRLVLPWKLTWRPWWSLSSRAIDFVWIALVLAGVAYLSWQVLRFVETSLSWHDGLVVAANGGLTLLRVVILIVLASVVWVPVGISIGLRPRLAAAIQPIAQFLAAFPANLLFPVAVFLIVRFGLAPKIWLTPLMILGTQWYILFNVIAGASAFPSDLREAAASLRVRPWRWWRQVILPGVFPYYVTGAITASGGAWNASIVSEAVSWGPTTLTASGLGAYIAQMTQAGDYSRIVVGVAMMSALVVAMNRLLWRPLYALAERKTRLD
jgi:NitT/TauT family transport system permease protein